MKALGGLKEDKEMSLRKVLFAMALAGGMLLPVASQAAVNYAVTALNMRTGPGTGYARVAVIPGGGAVQVYNCSGSWCNVNWRGRVGWVSARYLSGSYAPRRYYNTPAPYYYGGYPYSGFSFFFGAPYYNYGYYRPRYYNRYRYYPRARYYPRGRYYGGYPAGGYRGGYGGGYGGYRNFGGAPKMSGPGYGN
jgi:uncharacterized protein YraI